MRHHVYCAAADDPHRRLQAEYEHNTEDGPLDTWATILIVPTFTTSSPHILDRADYPITAHDDDDDLDTLRDDAITPWATGSPPTTGQQNPPPADPTPPSHQCPGTPATP